MPTEISDNRCIICEKTIKFFNYDYLKERELYIEYMDWKYHVRQKKKICWECYTKRNPTKIPSTF